jgi:hypothetical protein
MENSLVSYSIHVYPFLLKGVAGQTALKAGKWQSHKRLSQIRHREFTHCSTVTVLPGHGNYPAEPRVSIPTRVSRFRLLIVDKGRR